MKKKLTAVIAMAIVLSMFVTACAGNTPAGTSAATTVAATTAAASTAANTTAAATAAATTAAATTTAATQTTAAPVSDTPTDLTIFFQEGGATLPEGYDHAENWIIDYVQEKANINFTEVICPPYADTATRFELMMGSGEITDFVFRADPTTMKDFGLQGAFLPTKDIIRGNSVLNAVYSDEQIKAMESSDGVAYVIQIPPMVDDIDLMAIRLDLVEKYGYKYEDCASLETITEVARALKADMADSIPFTTRGFRFFWFPYAFNTAVDGWKFYPEDKEFRSGWQGDNIVSMLQYLQGIYAEGLLDQEWLTNDSSAEKQKKNTNNVLIYTQNYASIIGAMLRYTNDYENGRLVPVSCPMAENVGVSSMETLTDIVGSYAFGISSRVNDEKLQGINRFLEVLYSDELAEMTTYGREGIEYTVDNGRKVLCDDFTDIRSTLFDFSWVTVNNEEKLYLYYLTNIVKMDPAMSQDEQYAFIEDVQGKYRDVKAIQQSYGTNPNTFMAPASLDISNTINEVSEYQKSTVAKVVLGQMSIDEFIAERDAFVAKYQYITDDFNVRYQDSLK